MANYLATDTDLTAVANAIRTKGGTSAQLAFPQGFVDAIAAIQTGGGEDHTVEDALLTRSFSGTYENSRITSLGGNALRGIRYLTSVSFPNVTTIGDYAMQYAYELVACSFPKATSIGSYGFSESKVVTVSLPLVTQIKGNAFTACKQTKTLCFPILTTATGSSQFNDMWLLEKADMGNLANIVSNAFYGARVIQALILRKSDAICTLANSNAFNSSKFTGYGGSYSGHIYVPSALLATYQTATNWATLYGNYNDLFAPIEGSIYETEYADGTPIT